MAHDIKIKRLLMIKRNLNSIIEKVMAVIIKTPQHRYQLLTKRADRMRHYFTNNPIPHNVWLGVTVEGKASKRRIEMLRELNATIRFLSCEPLLEDLGQLDLTDIDWIIVGGESGPKARPMELEWNKQLFVAQDVQAVAEVSEGFCPGVFLGA
jgi:protein gp37